MINRRPRLHGATLTPSGVWSARFRGFLHCLTRLLILRTIRQGKELVVDILLFMSFRRNWGWEP